MSQTLPLQKPKKAPPTSRRSSIACTRCHQSKIKCDVSVLGSPCTRCKERGITDCEPIRSRRGTYDRKEWLKKVRARKEAEQLQRDLDRDHHIQDHDHDHDHDRTHDGFNHTNDLHSRLLHDQSYSDSDITPKSEPASVAGSGSFDLSPNSFFDTTDLSPIPASPVSTRSASQFDPFSPFAPSPSSISHIQPSASAMPLQLPTHSILPHPPHIPAFRIAALHEDHCFDMPEPALMASLLTAYFQHIHSTLPILLRHRIAQQFYSGTIPWLLLNSIAFVAASHVPLHLLPTITHKEARRMYYDRAKALWDEGYELDDLVLIQSTILLSNWGGRPTDYWNPSAWIDAAVSVAERISMNVASTMSGLTELDKIKRRCWWTLVVRDTFCATLLGKPVRINLSQASVPMLTLSDFVELNEDLDDSNNESSIPLEAIDESVFVPPVNAHAMYYIEATKLAQVLRTIAVERTRNHLSRDNLFGSPSNAVVAVPLSDGFVLETLKVLDEWRHGLPAALRFPMVPQGRENYILSASLSLMYNHNLVFLHQATFSPSEQRRAGRRGSVVSVAIAQDAVTEIADLGAALVTSGDLSRVASEAFNAFFMAIVLLFTQVQEKLQMNENATNVTLLRTQLKVCEMVVYKTQEYWDHAEWILALGESLHARL
ncbi:fungal-specific transcription factor domain-containing protein, partial [Lipomyces oligophaga]|uniref:fungal-specific transcription factor domain-containing protein n=1 Tax=Lipomyces oligophaga TaxID=45792 RepID=UPI0034CF3433